MLVEEDSLESIPLYCLQKGEVFKFDLDGNIWVKGTSVLLTQEEIKNNFPCISLNNGVFSWINKDARVYRAKKAICKVDF